MRSPAELPVQRGTAAALSDAALAVTYQGCAEAGLCYPPITQTVTVALPGRAAVRGAAAGMAPAPERPRPPAACGRESGPLCRR